MAQAFRSGGQYDCSYDSLQVEIFLPSRILRMAFCRERTSKRELSRTARSPAHPQSVQTTALVVSRAGNLRSVSVPHFSFPGVKSGQARTKVQYFDCFYSSQLESLLRPSAQVLGSSAPASPDSRLKP